MNPKSCWELGVDALCFGEAEIDYPTLLENWDKRFDPEIRKKIKNFVLNDEELKKLLEMREKIINLEEGEEGRRLINTGKIPDLIDQEYQEFARRFLTGEELDEFPYYFGLEKTYINVGGKLIPKTPENMFGIPQHQAPQDQNLLVYAYTRGCVHRCTYCYYHNLEKITGQRTFRRLSPQKAIKNLKHGREELEKARQEIVNSGGDAGPDPFLLLMNSDTCAVPAKELGEFCEEYKRHIGYPFYCMNNPLSATKEKMRMLAQAGMVHMNFGVQTNEDVNKRCYNRNSSNERVKNLTEWAKEIEKENGLHIDIFLDFIIYNPFENREDLKKTIEFIKTISPPFDYVPHTLFLGLESPLYEEYQTKKKESQKNDKPMDKLLQDYQDEEYSNFHDTYRFYRKLRNNKEFVPNTICEFMAGQINKKMFGRLPRYTQELKTFDVFDKKELMKVVEKEIRKKHNLNPDPQKKWEKYISNTEWAEKYKKEREIDIDNFLEFILEKINNAKDKDLTIDLLMSDEVLNYFDNHKDVFINIALTMKDLHPQQFTNENPNLKKFHYEDEYPDTSTEVNFG